MKLRWQQPGTLRSEPEFVIGCLAAPLFCVALFAVTLLPARYVPPCRFRQLSGIPCPTCGSFRALEHLLAGDIIGAWISQPLVTTMAACGLLFMCYSWIVVILRLPRLRLRDCSARSKWVTAGIVTPVVLINWIYLLISGR